MPPRIAAGLTAEDVAALTGVSRETLATLEAYVALLARWNRRINLVGRASLDDVWRRHVLDCVQLRAHAPADRRWLDLGSGAGLPGLVLAICGVADMHLVESDSRKCAFLVEAARTCGVEVKVHNARAETLAPVGADVVTARAFAPLPRLLPAAHRHLAAAGELLLLKGQDVVAELTEAQKYWNMRVDTRKSLSDNHGKILRISGLRHVHPN